LSNAPTWLDLQIEKIAQARGAERDRALEALFPLLAELADRSPITAARYKGQVLKAMPDLRSRDYDRLLTAARDGKREPDHAVPERPSAPAPAPAPQDKLTLKDFRVGSDAWGARLLADIAADRLAYVPAWGWLAWDGRRWERCGETHINTLGLELLTRAIVEQALALSDNKERAAWLEAAARIQNRPRLANTVALASGWLTCTPDDFDQHPELLNTQNGIVDLTTGKLFPHQPDLRLTQITAVPYIPGDCPQFKAFLNEIFAHNTRLVGYLKRLLGYALLGHNRERIFVIFWGHGANGKSTLCNILEGVLGDYLREARPESFESQRPGEIRARNDLAALRAARVVTMGESREGAHFDAALIKQVTGGDPIVARFLFHEDFSFHPAFLPILRTNFKPHLPGGDPALWARIRLIPFTVQIPPERQNKNLADQILRSEGPGILAWLVEGCLEYQLGGLQDPPEVLEATNQYREETDPIWAFIQECCVVGENEQEEAGKLYGAYQQWCGAQGVEAKSLTAFGRALSNLGFDAYHDRKVRYRLGLRLKGNSDITL
jgi:putative DNA primase/helicase